MSVSAGPEGAAPYVEVSSVVGRRERRRRPLLDSVSVRFEDARPVRPFRWPPGGRYFPGWYWAATTRQHAQRFGTDNRWWARGMAVRARCYDREVRAFLARHPRGAVVCLGEGLETQFWRVDNGTVQWLGVELADSAALRRRLLPDTDRRRTLTGSLLDERWMREVDASDGVLVLAQGVLMYVAWDRVRALVEACTARFPGAGLVFDTPPAWFAAGTVRGRFRYPAGYRPPPMPWGMTPARLRELRACPGVATA
ncbi:class I SAM-dependent methyltransferase [Streptomyces mirabilis]|uniref:class I SAM-dependent methyltransferase n=1 Tax=Streptomyces mirabilis TaxID=68239 RepID=UPI0035DD1E2B